MIKSRIFHFLDTLNVIEQIFLFSSRERNLVPNPMKPLAGIG